MNTVAIPPGLGWYVTSIVACAPDNTLVYGARFDIVVVKQTDKDIPLNVRIITRAHQSTILSVAVNNKNWGPGHKYAVTVCDNKIIKLWDIENMQKVLSHNHHLSVSNTEKVVGVTFAGDDRVISVSETGKIVIWNILLNSFDSLDLFNGKDTVTCLSTCPHAAWLTAFGFKNGMVMICDLRRQGKILYKLRGHEKSVLDLAWCPVPVNVFPQNPRNTVGMKKRSGTPELESVDGFDDPLNGLCEQVVALDVKGDTPTTTSPPVVEIVGEQGGSGDQERQTLPESIDDKAPESSEEVKIGNVGQEPQTLETPMVVDKIPEILKGIKIENGGQECPKTEPETLKQSEEIKVETVSQGEANVSKETEVEVEKSNQEEPKVIETEKEQTPKKTEKNKKGKSKTSTEAEIKKEETPKKSDKVKEEKSKTSTESEIKKDSPPKKSGKGKKERSKTSSESEKKEETPKKSEKAEKVKAKTSSEPDVKDETPKISEEVKGKKKKRKGSSTDTPEEVKKEPVVQAPTPGSKKTDKKKKENPWINLKHADDDEQPKITKNAAKAKSPERDFAAECRALKEKIMGVVDEPNSGRKICKRNRKKGKQNEEEAVKNEQSEEKPQVNVPRYLELNEDVDQSERTESAPDSLREVPQEINNDESEQTQSADEQTESAPESLLEIAQQDSQMMESEQIQVVNDQTESAPESLRDVPQAEGQNVESEQIEVEAEEERTESAPESLLEIAREDNQNMETESTEDAPESLPQEQVQNMEVNTESPAQNPEEQVVERIQGGAPEVAQQHDNIVQEEEVQEADAAQSQAVIITRSPVDSVEEEPRREYLLASSAREGHIYIWRAGTDGRMQTFLNLPNKPFKKMRAFNSEKVFVTLAWPTPNMLLCTSKFGELLQWTVPKPCEKERHVTNIHKDHGSIIFKVMTPMVLGDEYNWKNLKPSNVWSAGIDRRILNTSLGPSKANLACITTLGGQVTCLSASPFAPTKVALGTSEGVFKVWDLSKHSAKSIQMTHFYSKVKNTVTCLRWDPRNETGLVFGTTEGRVGLVDSSNPNKMPILVKHFFKDPIHQIDFGPLKGYEKRGLYIVSEGRLGIYDLQNLNNEPELLKVPEGTYVFNAAWKPRHPILVVSTKNKSLLVFDGDLNLKKTHYILEKFNNIIWHPQSAQKANNLTKYSKCFAATNVTKNFFLGTLHDDTVEFEVFTGHSGNVLSLSWCPFDKDLLCSVGEEGSAQVWNMATKTLVGTFNHPSYEPLTTVVWSPLFIDQIIVGSKDHTVYMWNISENPPRVAEEISEHRREVLKQVIDETFDLVGKGSKTATEKSKSEKHATLFPGLYTGKNPVSHIADLHKLLDWMEARNRGETSRTQGLNAQQNDLLKMYGSKEEVNDLIKKDLKTNRDRSKFSNVDTITLIQGDIKAGVQAAIEHKRVNPWIISVAPMISTDVWRKACETYAHQLMEIAETDPLELMTYLLVLHNVEDAINSLCERGLYREAFILAKVRLPDGHETITKVIESWRHHAFVTGQFELAAQHDIALGQYERAAQLLYRRSDVPALELAVALSQKTKNQDLKIAVMQRLQDLKMVNPS